MNPAVPQAVIDRATERDPASAAAEYLAEFRSDIEGYITREVIQAATVPGRNELPPVSSCTYAAFVDPSGGSSDSMTLAIAHRDHQGHGILDALHEVRPPFSPDSVVQEFAVLLRSYGIHEITGDRYAGEWPRARFAEHGVTKLIPNDAVLEKHARRVIEQQMTERVIATASEQIAKRAQETGLPTDLRPHIEAALDEQPELSWDVALSRVVRSYAQQT